MSRRAAKRVRWTAAAVIPVLLGAAALLQKAIDAETRNLASAEEDLTLRSPEAVKRLSMGYDALLADVYWTRAVQYYGARVGADHPDFHLLWPLLDVTTTLDPKLIVAYHFGAIFLSEPGVAGASRTDLAIELVKKGIAANPRSWQLGTDLGFLYYWRMHDYPNAAAAYLATSKIPGAPAWTGMMAARIAEKGGSLDTSNMIWTQIYETTNDPNVKKFAGEQLLGLRALKDMELLSGIAEKYKQEFGRYPASSEEMRQAGLLVGIPVDPEGSPYVIGADGKARLNPQTSYILPAPPTNPGKPAR